MAEWIENASDECDLPSKTLKVIDAGCGNGELTRILCSRGWSYRNICAYDIEPGHVDVARNRIQSTGVCVFCSDGLELSEFSFPFMPDLIVAIGWLHNDWPSLFATGIPSRAADGTYLRKTITVFSRLLRTRGRLIFDKIPPDTPELSTAGFRVIESITVPCGDTFHIAEKVA